jgi:hypothetical protein
VGVALSIVATVLWVLFFVLIEDFATELDGNFYDDLELEPQSAPLVAVRLTASALRLAAGF